MATFGPIAPVAPNVLFNPMAAIAAGEGMQRNRLLMQQALAEREREETGRRAAALMAENPGDPRYETMARATLPAAEQFKLAQRQQEKQEMNALLAAMIPGLAGAAPAAPAGIAGNAAGAGPAPAVGGYAPDRNYVTGEARRAAVLGADPAALADVSAAQSPIPERPGGYRANPGVAGQNAGLPPPSGTVAAVDPATAAQLALAARSGNPMAMATVLGQASQRAEMARRAAADDTRADISLGLQQRNHAESMEMRRQEAARAAAAAQRQAERDAQQQATTDVIPDPNNPGAVTFRPGGRLDPEVIRREAAAREEAKARPNNTRALEKVREAETEAARVTGAIDRFGEVFRQQGGGSVSAYVNNPRDPAAQQLNTAFENLKMVMRSEALMNTGVLQPGEMRMLQDTLLAPTSVRGLMASPQAMQAKLDEIKAFVNRGVEAQRASVGAAAPAQAAPAQAPQRLRFNPATGRIE